MIAINLSKQPALRADPRTIQQINFTANLDRAPIKRKRTILDFFKRNCKSILKHVTE